MLTPKAKVWEVLKSKEKVGYWLAKNSNTKAQSDIEIISTKMPTTIGQQCQMHY